MLSSLYKNRTHSFGSMWMLQVVHKLQSKVGADQIQQVFLQAASAFTSFFKILEVAASIFFVSVLQSNFPLHLLIELPLAASAFVHL